VPRDITRGCPGELHEKAWVLSPCCVVAAVVHRCMYNTIYIHVLHYICIIQNTYMYCVVAAVVHRCMYIVFHICIVFYLVCVLYSIYVLYSIICTTCRIIYMYCIISYVHVIHVVQYSMRKLGVWRNLLLLLRHLLWLLTS
jgi:hypothetical protein